MGLLDFFDDGFDILYNMFVGQLVFIPLENTLARIVVIINAIVLFLLSLQPA